MSLPIQLANTLWSLSARPRTRRFLRALHHPAQTQHALLRRYLTTSAHTLFGKAHRFETLTTPERFQQAIPLSTYDDYTPYIEKIAAGEPHILTRDPVRYFALSSGSSAAEKWLPYTPSLLAEFNEAISPWISTLFAAHPRARHGPAYWSISPILPPRDRPSAIPVGFDDDSAYLGGIFKHLVNATLAAPGELRHVTDMNAFRYLTLLALLRMRTLALVSVWHPSFLTLLLAAAPAHWNSLLRDVHDGTLTPPVDAPAVARAALSRSPNRARARELESLGPHFPASWWPNLTLLSAWSDAHAATSARELQALFPQVPFQPKGLLATEGVTTFPLSLGNETYYPLALRSHFFEFLADDGTPRLAHELDLHATYTVVLTTAGGLYRYRTGDAVSVTGRLFETPTLRFLGKADASSDLRGEKLNALFVGGVLNAFHRTLPVEPSFSMLAPAEPSGTAPGYVLYLELPARTSVPPSAAATLDALLCRNPHYAYCRALGQLARVRLFRIDGASAAKVYLETCARRGQRLGNIKPSPLHRGAYWSAEFPGALLDDG
jgi:hypothetical protein